MTPNDRKLSDGGGLAWLLRGGFCREQQAWQPGAVRLECLLGDFIGFVCLIKFLTEISNLIGSEAVEAAETETLITKPERLIALSVAINPASRRGICDLTGNFEHDMSSTRRSPADRTTMFGIELQFQCLNCAFGGSAATKDGNQWLECRRIWVGHTVRLQITRSSRLTGSRRNRLSFCNSPRRAPRYA